MENGIDQMIFLLKFLANMLAMIFNEVLCENQLPSDWFFSSLLPDYKRKCYFLNANPYKDIKLWEYTFKLHGRNLDKRPREIVDVMRR